jgi:hypothetical protein
MSLCQLDQRSDLMSPTRSRGLKELYDAFRGLFIIFYHQDHTCTVKF